MPERLKVMMKAPIDLLRIRMRKRNLLTNLPPNSRTKKDRKREKKQRSRSRRRNQSPLPKPAVQQPDVSNIHIPQSSDAAENMPTREHEDVDDNTNKKVGEEETHIQEAQKVVPKMKKTILKSEGKQPIEKKDAQLSTGDALLEEKISSSGQDIQMAPQQLPLKYEKDGNENRMYRKAFTTRMIISSFSSMMA
ncbi:hypothetical protein Cgig2_009065 [Carnegiea gigantea]|uniref:Uncharacterized protein n=1 Tax=Carnegiea gigantea TaxID=171969 RepID=A0A9Q1JTH5_9CARY|nr:hypothetical protein Cgig2_009065 [Carnegiea gigantea]